MKMKILKTAIDLFSNDGYFTTSMQKIAEECGMSKATLYKYFESKEELLIQVFEYTLEQMFERSRNINLPVSLSKKERLREKILVELEGNKEYRGFLNLIFRAIPIHQSPRVITLMKRTKAAFLNWHRQCISEAYGEVVEPYIWDLVLLLQGTLREYIDLLENEQKPIDKGQVATLIVSHLDKIVSSGEKPIPALSEEMMSDYRTFSLGQMEKSKEEQVTEVLASVKSKVEKVEIGEKKLEELREAFDSLEKEMLALKQKKYMVEALCFFIDSRVDIKQEIPMILALIEDVQ